MKPKKKKCPICRGFFMPRNSLVKACGVKCAIALVRLLDEKKAAKNRLQEARKQKADKERIKTKSELMKEAQAACNAYIRFRDRLDPCISCGRPVAEVESVDVPGIGGFWDAGHYRSRGACPELRFHPHNIHKQCKKCNAGSAKWSHTTESVSDGYKAGILAKLGSDVVAWLDRKDHPPAKYNADDYRFFRDFYREALKNYKKR